MNEEKERVKETILQKKTRARRQNREWKRERDEKRLQYKETGEAVKQKIASLRSETINRIKKRFEQWHNYFLRALEIRESNVG